MHKHFRIFGYNLCKYSLVFGNNYEYNRCERGDKVPLKFKIDILEALKLKGYTTYKLQQDKLLANSTIQKLRTGGQLSWTNIETICKLLNCQPGDIIEYVEDEKGWKAFFFFVPKDFDFLKILYNGKSYLLETQSFVLKNFQIDISMFLPENNIGD